MCSICSAHINMYVAVHLNVMASETILAALLSRWMADLDFHNQCRHRPHPHWTLPALGYQISKHVPSVRSDHRLLRSQINKYARHVSVVINFKIYPRSKRVECNFFLLTSSVVVHCTAKSVIDELNTVWILQCIWCLNYYYESVVGTSLQNSSCSNFQVRLLNAAEVKS